MPQFFASRDAPDACESYVREGVWVKVEVKPFRLAVLDGKTTP